MAVLQLDATGSLLSIKTPIHLTSTQVEYDTCDFDFSVAWDGYTKTAVFYSNPSTIKTQLLVDDACTIPWDALSGGKELYIGVYGISGGSVLPTNFVLHEIHPGAYIDGEAPAEPSPSVYQQVIDALAATVPAAEAAAVSASAAAASAMQLAAGLLRPKGVYADLAALTAGTPTVADTDEIYITLADGKWCYHNGLAWVAGGAFVDTTAAGIFTEENEAWEV